MPGPEHSFKEYPEQTGSDPEQHDGNGNVYHPSRRRSRLALFGQPFALEFFAALAKCAIYLRRFVWFVLFHAAYPTAHEKPRLLGGAEFRPAARPRIARQSSRRARRASHHGSARPQLAAGPLNAGLPAEVVETAANTAKAALGFSILRLKQ